jgi:excisionase family DNA binding protein
MQTILPSATGRKSAGPQKRCYTVQEWCIAYGLSRSTFYQAVSSGDLKAFKLGGRTLVTAEAAEEYLAREAIPLPMNTQRHSPRRDVDGA